MGINELLRGPPTYKKYERMRIIFINWIRKEKNMKILIYTFLVKNKKRNRFVCIHADTFNNALFILTELQSNNIFHIKYPIEIELVRIDDYDC